MELRRTLTGGLAWAGLVVVVAVPAVEIVRSKLVHERAGTVQTVAEIEAPALPSATVPVVPAGEKKAAGIAAKPTVVVHAAAPAAVSSAETPTMPVAATPSVKQTSVSTVATTTPVVPKAVPSKSSSLPASPVATAATTTPSGNDTALDKYLATGKPLPSYLKASPPPAAPIVQPVGVAPTAGAAQVASTDESGGVILSTDTPAAAPPPVPMPVAARPKIASQRLVTEADLKGWKSGSLADYLRQRGLLSPADSGDGSGN